MAATPLSATDRSDFSYVLDYDAHRRLTALGIEFDGFWHGMRGHTVFPTKTKSRRKVAKMIDAWKRGHLRPASK